MADVAVNVKIYLENPEKADEVLNKIKEKTNLKDSKIEDVGFGIKIIRGLFIIPDSEGGTDKLEEQLKSIEGISNIEVESATRLS